MHLAEDVLDRKMLYLIQVCRRLIQTIMSHLHVYKYCFNLFEIFFICTAPVHTYIPALIASRKQLPYVEGGSRGTFNSF